MRVSIRHPARLVPLAFVLAIAVGSALLMLPVARAGPGGAPLLVALFTSTSAVCVASLIVVDTPTYWTGFGQGVILALIQIGGLGIMTGATMLGLLVSRRLGLRSRLIAQAETRGTALGDVSAVLRLILTATIIVEAAVALALALRLRASYGQAWGDAFWNGVFQSVSAFNNAGFSTFSDSAVGFALDPLFLWPIMIASILGGLGFPVLYELRKELFLPRLWSLHTKLTLAGTALLLGAGFSATLAFEWSNAATLGPMEASGKALNALFHSVMTRTAGFNSVDIGRMRAETLLVTDVLMLIGGGSAGTAGGIKVTTFLLLGMVVWAEIRAEQDAAAFGRRVSSDVQRQAVTVVLLAVAVVAAGTLVLLGVSGFGLDAVLFESISAFATVGLSTGITARLPADGQIVLILLMFIGRVGTITVATAFALQGRRRPYRYPEERPIVG